MKTTIKSIRMEKFEGQFTGKVIVTIADDILGFVRNVDADGVIHAEGRLSTPDYAFADDFVIALDAKLKEMVAENSGLKLIGIGIGAPNANFNKGTIELAPNLRWKGIIPLVRITEKLTGLKTRITNDANDNWRSS